MAFRANEEIESGRQEALGKLLGRSIDKDALDNSTSVLQDLLDKHGPVVSSYPYWHPLVTANEEYKSPVTVPGLQCGYRGLDHTVFLRNGFITCPYDSGEAVLKSVEELKERGHNHGVADILAEKIDAQLYHPNAQPILVTCAWLRPLNRDGTIPTSLAVPLLLERELAVWRHSEVAETWKTMSGYVLGRPCGSRSSLFINEETGQALKTIWNSLINTGMFGPVRVGSW